MYSDIRACRMPMAHNGPWREPLAGEAGEASGGGMLSCLLSNQGTRIQRDLLAGAQFFFLTPVPAAMRNESSSSGSYVG